LFCLVPPNLPGHLEPREVFECETVVRRAVTVVIDFVCAQFVGTRVDLVVFVVAVVVDPIPVVVQVVGIRPIAILVEAVVWNLLGARVGRRVVVIAVFREREAVSVHVEVGPVTVLIDAVLRHLSLCGTSIRVLVITVAAHRHRSGGAAILGLFASEAITVPIHVRRSRFAIR